MLTAIDRSEDLKTLAVVHDLMVALVLDKTVKSQTVEVIDKLVKQAIDNMERFIDLDHSSEVDESLEIDHRQVMTRIQHVIAALT